MLMPTRFDTMTTRSVEELRQRAEFEGDLELAIACTEALAHRGRVAAETELATLHERLRVQRGATVIIDREMRHIRSNEVAAWDEVYTLLPGMYPASRCAHDRRYLTARVRALCVNDAKPTLFGGVAIGPDKTCRNGQIVEVDIDPMVGEWSGIRWIATESYPYRRAVLEDSTAALVGAPPPKWAA